MQTILVVDDDSRINAMLTEALTQAGYAVINAYSGTEALLVLQQAPQPDLILLDLMLLGRSGEDVFAQLPPVPVSSP
ncbi:MAG: response regulator [Schleiferilactobacillus perolens]|uniref:response regulator n=1 Tax=Schleiferilactobacillus perolens TaxID=100468 RepID=UPI0039E9D1BE